MLKKSASRRTTKVASLTLMPIETLKDFSNLISFNVNSNSNHSEIMNSYNLVAVTSEATPTLSKCINLLDFMCGKKI